jgi:hypothetical protein
MGKAFVLGVVMAIGYSIGFRDARANSDHVLTRAVEQIRVTFGAKPTNDIDAAMSRLEGKP